MTKSKKEKKVIKRAKAIVAAGLVTFGGIAIKNQINKHKYTVASVVSSNEKQTPIIEKDGIELELDDGSIAIVKGEIQEGENYAFVYDQSGNILDGNISGDNLRGGIEISEKDLQEYVIYQVVSTDGTQLTQTEGATSNISYGDFVLGQEQHGKYVYALYPSEDEIVEGKIDEKTLEVVNELSSKEQRKEGTIRMVVDTSADDYIKLNFRVAPNEDKSSIRLQIPNGTIIDSTGETTTENGREWTRVKYERLIGWVATEYLKELANQEEITKEGKQENLNMKIRNISGGVTGIDVSSVFPDQLREIIENGIPESVSTENFGTVNTERFSGGINFVQMKIGASPYGHGEFGPLDYSGYEELVEICEELQIPYGFYYYSTATDTQEAKMEADYIQQVIEDLRSKYDMKYHIMPMSIDVELQGENDRQYQKNIEDLTDAKAYLINRIQTDGISEQTILYIPGRIIDSEDSDRLLNLRRLKEKIINPENFAIWLCAPTTQEGNSTQSTARYSDIIENEYGIEVASEQVVLDAHSPSGGRIDINNMEAEYFEKIANGIELNEATLGDDVER